MFYELCAQSDAGIFAIADRSGRSRSVVRLPDGAIVEEPLPTQRGEISAPSDQSIGIAAGGVLATIHHENLGLVAGYLPFSGMFLLPSGDVAAVYGAKVNPIRVNIETSL